MQIQYERSQSTSSFNLIPLRIAGGVVFSLWAKIDLSQEEQYLFNRYRFRDALLVEGDPFLIFKKAVRSAGLLSVPVFVALCYLFSIDIAVVVVTLLFTALTFAYYDQLREHIYVRDLINGRTFRCFSVVELIEKESYLLDVCGYLRQVLESAKHWEGREIIEVDALSPDAAKQIVLKG